MKLALYRQYRPQKFSDIIGQDHIVETLKNQIKAGRLYHAYLFCGTRGVGKTTAARILARAANCARPAPNGDPCGVCPSCVKAQGTDVDIIEMDAASNSGVDYAREIRDKVVYSPSASKYKIYIIDEVHMLSGAAFNALLKTLEEPPAHVIFVLCTTEVQKLPQTILSRCMRFDFRLVPVKLLAELIGKIYNQCGVKYQAEAVNVIASNAEGSVRDALSLADRCMPAEGKTLTYDDALFALGVSGRRAVYALASRILSADMGGALLLAGEICGGGKSVSLLAKDLCEVFRDFLVIKSCKKDANSLLMLPQDVFAEAESAANKSDLKRLCRALDIFTSAEYQLKFAMNPRVFFDSLVIKASGDAAATAAQTEAVQPQPQTQPQQQAQVQPQQQPQQPKPQQQAFVSDDVPPPEPPPLEGGGRAAAAPPAQSVAKPVSSASAERAKAAWARVLSGVRHTDAPLLATVLSMVDGVYIEGEKLIIPCTAIALLQLEQQNNVKILSAFLQPEGLVPELREKPAEKSAEQSLREIEALSGGNVTII